MLPLRHTVVDRMSAMQCNDGFLVIKCYLSIRLPFLPSFRSASPSSWGHFRSGPPQLPNAIDDESDSICRSHTTNDIFLGDQFIL